MTVATERDTRAFSENFHFQYLPELSCFSNAVYASLSVLVTDKRLPRIIQVRLPDDLHAYLVYDGKVFNSGVTWKDDLYPSYSLDDLRRLVLYDIDGVPLCEDVTTLVLYHALRGMEAEENGADEFRYLGQMIAPQLPGFAEYRTLLCEDGILQPNDEYTPLDYYKSMLTVALMMSQDKTPTEYPDLFPDYSTHPT